MSRYSAFDKLTGQWAEITWRKQRLSDNAYRYIVKVGDRSIGEVWPTDKEGWLAISYAQGSELLGFRSVEGFASRWYATVYLLNVGVRPPKED